jgi:methionine synthase I (cobalamin-dependent)/5,10-methylenetetrahydrofolate reductase
MDSLFSNGILVFDGAVGTELYKRGFYINRPFEELNLSAPAEVEKVHSAYLEAGADVITTNTFASSRPQLANFDIVDRQQEILFSALKSANDAVEAISKSPAGLKRKNRPAIGLSIGPMGDLVEPLGRVGIEEAEEEFRLIAEIARRTGQPFQLYILETFSNLDELSAAVSGIRKADAETPILASIHSKSSQKKYLENFARRFGNSTSVQALGINCSEGPSDLMKVTQLLVPQIKLPLIVQPNAGLPRAVNGRYFYMSSPDYMAKFAKRFIEAGARGVGGCCGTGPDHVAAITQAFTMVRAQNATNQTSPTAPGSEATKLNDVSVGATLEAQAPVQFTKLTERTNSRVGQLLAQGKPVHSVEILPPKGTDLEKFSSYVDLVEKEGFPFINVPDGARASTRVNSLHIASFVAHRQSKLNSEKIRILPHFTTRDRNLIALQSDLLGCSINGVHDVLLVTGDPPKLGTNRDATAVYDIDSIGLTYLAASLNRGVSPTGDELGEGTEFGIGVASNPTAINLEVEIQRWNYKVQSGADFAVTQPIFDPESYFRWRDKIGAAYRPHVIGIWPLVSMRNAEFMANEVPGVHVPAWVLEEMSKATTPEESIKRGVEIAQKAMQKLVGACEGFCVSAPLGRVPVALETLRPFREMKLS